MQSNDFTTGHGLYNLAHGTSSAAPRRRGKSLGQCLTESLERKYGSENPYATWLVCVGLGALACNYVLHAVTGANLPWYADLGFAFLSASMWERAFYFTLALKLCGVAAPFIGAVK